VGEGRERLWLRHAPHRQVQRGTVTHGSTATFAHDRWWFGCYGDPKILLVTDADFQMKGRYEFDCSLGIVGLPDSRFLSATGKCEKDKGCMGSVRIAVPDEKTGLKFLGRGDQK
jgi:hypothetical protein